MGVAALACGLIAIGTCNGDVTSVILQTMMERSASELKDHYARFLALGLGLAYLGMTTLNANGILSKVAFASTWF